MISRWTIKCATLFSTIILVFPGLFSSDVNKDLRLKAKTKNLDPKAKAKAKDLGPKAKANDSRFQRLFIFIYLFAQNIKIKCIKT